MTGIIKKKLAEKGFGFIQDETTNQEYFFHRDSCDTPFEKLRVGDRVSFEVMSAPKGPRAEQVKLI